MYRPHRLALLILLWLTAVLYAPSLRFGFIWDDPLWFGRVVGQPAVELARPSPDFQFYRPGTMLYNRLFAGDDGSFPAPLMHTTQVGWHLLNVALVYALSRRMGLTGGMAVSTAALVAWHPFSHQAVAWVAPQQPMTAALQNGAWLAYLLRPDRFLKPVRSSFILSLILFAVALTVQESTVALALVPLLLDWGRVASGKLQVANPKSKIQNLKSKILVYPLLAAVFLLVWLGAPRGEGNVGLIVDGRVALYLLQGFIYPLLGRPAGYSPEFSLPPPTFLAILLVTVTLLGWLAWRKGYGRLALVGLAWAALGITPPAVGLPYVYVSLASRLFYYSAPGVALLWTLALWPGAGDKWQVAGGKWQRSASRRLASGRGAGEQGSKGAGDKSKIQNPKSKIGYLLLAAILLQSSLLLLKFQRMYAAGATHLAELIRSGRDEGIGGFLPAFIAPSPNPRYLFVNFPDRYALKRPPYPDGYWGVTLAPVSVELGNFATLSNGQGFDSLSRSMPWLEAEARAAGPYQVDMRGVITPPEELYELARQVDSIFLSHYRPDGRLQLEWAGAGPKSNVQNPKCQLAQFGRSVCLQEAQVIAQDSQLILRLAWLSLAAGGPHETIFAHLGAAGQPPVAQSDGDAWLGMLPLSVWRPGDTLYEQRTIALPETPPVGRFAVQLGVYNWVSGGRLPATQPDGRPLPDDTLIIGYYP
ncbi:MAG: hypothetical protein AB1791_12995 [Chloroflexota bacterium]